MGFFFSITWEQCKVGELGSIVTGNTPPTAITDYYSDDGLIWVTPTDINQNITTSTARRLSEKGEYIARVVPPKTILVTCIASIGKNTLLGSKGSFNQQINALVPAPKNDPYFLFTQSYHWSSHMKRLGGALTFQIVNKKEFSEIDILVPQPDEQKKIGSLFNQIDSLITLHQRKYDKLVNTKKALLDKMFPKNGELVPKLRFKGFTDAWEQCELSELAQITMGQSPNGINYTSNPEDNILVQGNADMQNGWVTPRVWTTQITKIAEPNDLIFSVRAPVGAVGKTHFKAVIGRGVASIRGNEFVFQELLRLNMNNHWKTISTGSTFDSINSTELKTTSIKAPQIDEQNKIGDFLKSVDTLITLHQRKYEKLKNIKKALLQKMFV